MGDVRLHRQTEHDRTGSQSTAMRNKRLARPGLGIKANDRRTGFTNWHN